MMSPLRMRKLLFSRFSTRQCSVLIKAIFIYRRFIYIVNEIEAKIQELAHKDDPENTHNFTVEL